MRLSAEKITRLQLVHAQMQLDTDPLEGGHGER